VADIAARNFGLPASEVLDALLEREAAGSTGVGHGVAVPHARLRGLTRMRGVFMRLEQPTAFESVDDQPVDLVFALFAPAEADTEHLRTLARVSRLLRQGDLRQKLRQARTAESIHALLAREPQSSAA
jgi:PTS system nitrogen regulatory IIA component